MNPILGGISFILGVVIVVVGWMGIAPAAGGLGNSLIQTMPNACLGGICLPQFVSNTYYLFGIGVVMMLTGLAIWFFASVTQDEFDTEEYPLV